MLTCRCDPYRFSGKEFIVTIFLGILFGFVGLCIVGLVLLQEGKGGGIAAMGVPGMDTIMGARNPLRRLTVIFSIIFLVLILGINVYIHQRMRGDIPDAAPLELEDPEAPAEAAAPDGNAEAERESIADADVEPDADAAATEAPAAPAEEGTLEAPTTETPDQDAPDAVGEAPDGDAAPAPDKEAAADTPPAE